MGGAPPAWGFGGQLITPYCKIYNLLRIMNASPGLGQILWHKRSTEIWILYLAYPLDTGQKLEYNGTFHQLFIDLKKTYDSVRTEALYAVLIVF
jgi:hypothetical protein